MLNGEIGIYDAIGHVDFYGNIIISISSKFMIITFSYCVVNGGHRQPGCADVEYCKFSKPIY